jgi:invasion protein IalB
MRISYDDQYLFTCSEDGCLFVFKIADKDEIRGMKKEKATTFADEVKWF